MRRLRVLLALLVGAVALSGLLSIGLAMGLWGVFERRALATGSIARF